AHVLRLLDRENYQIVNVDVTVIAESPRLAPHTDAIRRSLAQLMGIAPTNVSIKAKSNEGMGWTGREEGIGVHAVALIDRIEDQDRVHERHSPGLPAL
ncbi:MAG: 2-C-methyl-D-erythritol 2,4-cyclodiphosphate synthase, partial [Gemmatimonadota bacterium]